MFLSIKQYNNIHSHPLFSSKIIFLKQLMDPETAKCAQRCLLVRDKFLVVCKKNFEYNMFVCAYAFSRMSGSPYGNRKILTKKGIKVIANKNVKLFSSTIKQYLLL